MNNSIGALLIESACIDEGVHSYHEIHDWYRKIRDKYQYKVTRIPFSKMTQWHLNENSGDFSHESGGFFSVRGLQFSCEIKGQKETWQQPIIDQPEIGILGFATRTIEGVLHLLVQAKMEPGNSNLIQLSPTVQATRSNYMRLHGGRPTRYLELFLDTKSLILDQLHSEQGTKYFKKRNRNMICIAPDNHLEEHDEYLWLTLGQISKLCSHENMVHLDTRSILGGINYYYEGINNQNIEKKLNICGYGAGVLKSICCDINSGTHQYQDIIHWITGEKFSRRIHQEFLGLSNIEDWVCGENEIAQIDKKYFSIYAVSVEAENREVSSWNQPLIHTHKGGVYLLISQEIDGILHFLIQCRCEPGLIDVVELAPTVQCNPKNHDQLNIPYSEYISKSSDASKVVFDSILAEEGGRFIDSDQRHLIIHIEKDINIEIVGSYRWMTLRQIQEIGRYSNYLNIELRSILSCVSPLLQ